MEARAKGLNRELNPGPHPPGGVQLPFRRNGASFNEQLEHWRELEPEATAMRARGGAIEHKRELEPERRELRA